MIIKKKILVESLPACMETISTLYPDYNLNQEDREKLTSIIRVLTVHPDAFRGLYTCYIEQTALTKFLMHANDIYDKQHHEATGLFVGYYLHSLEDDKKKVAIVTDFLPSYGNTTVTCEISYEETAKNATYCEKHKVLPLVWPHTHPFNRPLFFSSIDSETLALDFSAPHQMGFVCDNLRNAYMGFKIVNGKECHESLYSLDLMASMSKGVFTSECLYKKPLSFGEKKMDLQEKDENEEQESSDKEETTQTDLSELKSLIKHQSSQLNNVRILLAFIIAIQILLLALMTFPSIIANVEKKS